MSSQDKQNPQGGKNLDIAPHVGRTGMTSFPDGRYPSEHVSAPGANSGYGNQAYDVLQELLQPRGPSLKDFVTLLKKRKKIALGTFFTVIFLALVYVITAKDMFTATATLEIRGYSPIVGGDEIETLLQNDTRKVLYQATTIAKLSHLGLVDSVLSRDNLALEIKEYFKKDRSTFSKYKTSFLKLFGLGAQENHLDEEDPRYVHRQTFLTRYLRLLDINPVHETSLVQVRATTSDRRLSQRIANEHAEGLIRHITEEQHKELSGHLATLKAHADELQKKLAEAEAQVTKYADSHELVGLGDGATGELMLSKLTELNKLISTAQAQRAETESKVKSIIEGKPAPGLNLLDDETVKDLRTKLKEAESEYNALSRMVTGEYPKLVELRGKIDSLEGTIRRERQGNVSALKTQYESNVAAEQILVQQFQEQIKKAQQVSTQLVEYNLLQREATSLRDLTQSVLKSLNQTEITSSSNKSNVRISDYAPLPRTPSAPRRKTILVLSLVLGLMAGVGLAVLLELLDGTIKISEDAQAALGIPTLGIIPSFRAMGASKMIDEDPSWKSKVRALLSDTIQRVSKKSPPELPAPVMEEGEEIEHAEEIDGISNSAPVTAVAITSEASRHALAMPQTSVLDALRTLRANILFSSTQNSSRVILVASAREREGKTSVISNLAVTFARASQRTLLIDGDLRRPKVARRFGIGQERFGLVDFLAGQADLSEILCESPVDNLTIISAGSATVNATELLGSEKMAALISRLREEYDVILIDAAPVLPVADSLMLAQLAETVIFVVRSGKTEKSVAQEAVRRLRRVGAKVRGVVLNDFDPGEGSYSSDRYSVSKYDAPKYEGMSSKRPTNTTEEPIRINDL